jgi:uncharacterized RDD family membrane protein YckC
MKCPKCDYIGFEQAERCRNCGYDFSLSTAPPSADLSMRRDEPAAPLADLDLESARRVARRTPGVARRDPDMEAAGAAPASADLPLFGEDVGEPLPVIAASQPTPPLAVRRSVPAVPRPRVKPTPRSVEPQPELGFAFPEEVNRQEGYPGPRQGSTEGVLATAGLRAAAGLLDCLLLLGLNLVVLYFTIRVLRLSVADYPRIPIAPMAAFLLMLDGGYLALLTAAGGQTVGKMAFGLRVIGPENAGITAGGAALRTVVLLLSALPAGLGLVSILVDRDRRGLHDRLADTRVVHAPAP